MSKLSWDSFKEQFHPSWHLKMQKIIESPEMWEIMQFLKNESRLGKKLCPLSSDLFASFQVDLDKLRIVLMGMDVYPQYVKGKPASNGVALDCTNYGGISPSLEKLYSGIEQDCYNGLNLDYEKTLSLQYLVDQHVMLTNASLSTEMSKSGKHISDWQPFWKLVFEQIFSTQAGLIFIFMGKNAQYFERYTTPFLHQVLKCEHPVASSYGNRDFDHNKVFSSANKILEQNNGKDFKINWLKYYKQEENDCPF